MLAEHHIEQAQQANGSSAHIKAARAWSKAAVEEVKHLYTTNGDFRSYGTWRKTNSGQATKAAKEASAKTGMPRKQFKDFGL